MISSADQALQHHPRSPLSDGVVRRVAGLHSPDVICNQHDGRSQKKYALFAADTCPRSGFERFHKPQLDLVTHPQKTFIGKVSKGFDFLGVDHLPASNPQGVIHKSQITVHPSRVSLERLKGKLTEHFSSCVQFYEQGQLRNLARIERYLTHWLSWAQGAGITLLDSPLSGRVAMARRLQKIDNETCYGMTSLLTQWKVLWVNHLT